MWVIFGTSNASLAVWSPWHLHSDVGGLARLHQRIDSPSIGPPAFLRRKYSSVGVNSQKNELTSNIWLRVFQNQERFVQISRNSNLWRKHKNAKHILSSRCALYFVAPVLWQSSDDMIIVYWPCAWTFRFSYTQTLVPCANMHTRLFKRDKQEEPACNNKPSLLADAFEQHPPLHIPVCLPVQSVAAPCSSQTWSDCSPKPYGFLCKLYDRTCLLCLASQYPTEINIVDKSISPWFPQVCSSLLWLIFKPEVQRAEGTTLLMRLEVLDCWLDVMPPLVNQILSNGSAHSQVVSKWPRTLTENTMCSTCCIYVWYDSHMKYYERMQKIMKWHKSVKQYEIIVAQIECQMLPNYL